MFHVARTSPIPVLILLALGLANLPAAAKEKPSLAAEIRSLLAPSRSSAGRRSASSRGAGDAGAYRRPTSASQSWTISILGIPSTAG